MKTWIHRTAALATLIAAGFAHGKGVTDNEITLGLITDLSGPIANYGKESRNGATLAVGHVDREHRRHAGRIGHFKDMPGIAHHQARLLEDFPPHRLLRGLAGLQAATGQGPPLTATGSPTAFMHHQYAAVPHDHGGGPFSFAHATQANRHNGFVQDRIQNGG